VHLDEMRCHGSQTGDELLTRFVHLKQRQAPGGAVLHGNQGVAAI